MSGSVKKQPLMPIKVWPFGTDGDLIIEGGQTVTLPHGSLKDYRNVHIKRGGILEITGYLVSLVNQVENVTDGDPRHPTIIGCSGDFINDGKVIATRFLHHGLSVNTQAPDGRRIIGTVTQSPGGNGGGSAPGGSNPSGGPGVGTNGYGGGGDGGDSSGCSDCTIFQGGGGSNGSNGGSNGASSGGLGRWTGGAGNNVALNTRAGAHGGGSGGGSGGMIYYTAGFEGSTGGGGGGMKGLHGGFLWIKVCGTFSGTGLFDLRGSDGFNGGQGGDGQDSSATYYGGGGGGGAGGSGGRLEILCKNNSWTGSALLTAGAGGLGGRGGGNNVTSPPSFTQIGASGGNGTAGVVGTFTVTLI